MLKSREAGTGGIFMDRDRIKAAVTELLYAVGEDPSREGLLETPDRVAKMYEEIFGGLKDDPKNI